MIKVLVDDVNNYSKSELVEMIPSFPSVRKNKILPINNEINRLQSILVGKLQCDCFKDLKINPESIQIDENGKEYLPHSKYHYSIAHSGSKALFVISDHEVGCDIEEIKPRDISVAKRFFTNNECEIINSSQDSNKEFIKLWVIKESYLKALGLGLKKSLASFEVIKNGNDYSLSDNQYEIASIKEDDGYFLCVVTKRKK